MTKKALSLKKLSLNRELLCTLNLDSGQTSDAVTCTCSA
jgi:hypothetical protein